MANDKTPARFSHEKIETSNFLMIVLILLVIAVGGIVEIVPLYFQRSTTAPVPGLKPYTSLQLAGRDVYTREGCYNCHSQMIRTLVPDVLRYGDYSRLGESIYDHPFQWGSKRTGPDLARVGSKYPNLWHFRHMANPRDVSPGSNMPNYPWLFTQKTDVAALTSKLAVQRILGVPYPEYKDGELIALIENQEKEIAADLHAAGAPVAPDREIVALIAYLQKLGKYETVLPLKSAAK